jgi:hypothetical protein
MNSVEVVVINWKRPGNVERIVAALKAQTEDCTVTVCDCHPSTEFALTDVTLASVDRLYRWRHNCGAYSRYVPAGGYDHAYTFFLDDDMLPGLRCVEHFVRNARDVESFGVLGQLGRILPQDGVYRYGEVPRGRALVETDLVVRGYFVRTSNLWCVAKLRWMMSYFDEPLPEDDLLLCVSLQICAGLGCYLTPHDPDVETLMNKEELSREHALSMRAEHLDKRRDFLRRAVAYGWAPLRTRSNGREVASMILTESQ